MSNQSAVIVLKRTLALVGMFCPPWLRTNDSIKEEWEEITRMVAAIEPELKVWNDNQVVMLTRWGGERVCVCVREKEREREESGSGRPFTLSCVKWTSREV